MEPDFTSSLLLRFATALAIGMLIGIERGWRERTAAPGSRTAGVRTYALSSLLGAIAAELTRLLNSPLPLCSVLVAFVGLFAWFKSREMELDRDFSITGILAAFVAISLGAFSVLGDPTVAAASGVATTLLLAFRQSLHGWLARLTWAELRSALLLAAMTTIALPMLPGDPMPPYLAVSPRAVWLFMILTAAISYLGYVAIKIAGPTRGIVVGGLLGAIVSSTAVTIAYARHSVGTGKHLLFAGGALLAAAISVSRVAVTILIVSPPLLSQIFTPLLVVVVMFATMGSLFCYSGKTEAVDLPIGNPFDLLPLLGFAGAFVVVSSIGTWLSKVWGDNATVLTSAFSGLFDVDVAVLSTVAAFNEHTVSFGTAEQALLVAVAMNALSRSAFALAVGSMRFALIHVGTTLLTLATGAAALAIQQGTLV